MDVFDITCAHRAGTQPARANPFSVPWNADGLTLSKGNRADDGDR